MPSFRKGFFEEEAASGQKRNIGGFAPELRWRDDNEMKYVQFLLPMEEVIRLRLHEWINVGQFEKKGGGSYTKYETFISRKDPNIGEDYDDLEDRLDQYPKDRYLGVAVELEPVMEEHRGRMRPKSFRVKTETYQTKDGDKVQPVIGVVSQAQKNFWGWVNSYHNGHNPINEVPVEVTRRGKDKDTGYDFVPYDSLPVDYSGLFDNVDGISYLRDEFEDIDKAIADAADDVEAAQAVGSALLDKRMEELADKDRYDTLIKPLNTIKSKFPQQERKPGRTFEKRESNGDAEVSVDDDKAERFQKLKASVEGT